MSADQPIYLKIEEDIKKRIKDGTYKANQKLPTEREFIEMYHVSRMTARQAINNLVGQGYIYRIKGRGAFVHKSNIVQKNRSFLSFRESMKEYGIEITSEILNFKEILPPDLIRLNLKLDVGQKTYCLSRIRYADGEPIVVEDIYLPADRYPGLMNYDFSKDSLYGVMERDYDIFMYCVEETVTAVNLKEDMSLLLYGKSKGIALRLFDVVSDRNGIPLKCGDCFFNNEKYSYYKINIQTE